MELIIRTKESLRGVLGKELEILMKYLKPETRELKKVLALSRKLKVIFTRSQECGNINEE